MNNNNNKDLLTKLLEKIEVYLRKIWDLLMYLKNGIVDILKYCLNIKDRKVTHSHPRQRPGSGSDAGSNSGPKKSGIDLDELIPYLIDCFRNCKHEVRFLYYYIKALINDFVSFFNASFKELINYFINNYRNCKYEIHFLTQYIKALINDVINAFNASLKELIYAFNTSSRELISYFINNYRICKHEIHFLTHYVKALISDVINAFSASSTELVNSVIYNYRVCKHEIYFLTHYTKALVNDLVNFFNASLTELIYDTRQLIFFISFYLKKFFIDHVLDYIVNLSIYLAFFIFLLLTIALTTLLERKLMGSVQRRRGPNVVGFFGYLQPIADGLKLFLKEIIIPTNSNLFLYLVAPIFTLFSSILLWLVIPFDKTTALLDIPFSMLFLLAISSLAVYGIIFSGWASNSKHAFLGGLRSSAQMIPYEVCISFVWLTISLLGESLNLCDIVKKQEEAIWFIFPLFPLWIIFFIIVLAETNRAPFDLPEAEAELVAGYNVEYSSIAFALFFLGEYANMALMSGLCTLFFLGGWLPIGNIILSPYIWFGLKTTLHLIGFIWVRATLPRYRYDQLMKLGWKKLMPITIIFIMFSIVLMYIIKYEMITYIYRFETLDGILRHCYWRWVWDSGKEKAIREIDIGHSIVFIIIGKTMLIYGFYMLFNDIWPIVMYIRQFFRDIIKFKFRLTKYLFFMDLTRLLERFLDTFDDDYPRAVFHSSETAYEQEFIRKWLKNMPTKEYFK